MTLLYQSAQMTGFLLPLVAGLAYLCVSWIFGAIFGGDADGSTDSGDGVENEQTISIFSPRIIAMFFVGFGVGGGIATVFDAPVVIASLCGLAGGAGMGTVMVILMRAFYRNQANSDVSPHEAIGKLASVCLAVDGRPGEVLVSLRGQHMIYTAISQSNKQYSVGSIAKVVNQNGSTLILE